MHCFPSGILSLHIKYLRSMIFLNIPFTMNPSFRSFKMTKLRKCLKLQTYLGKNLFAFWTKHFAPNRVAVTLEAVLLVAAFQLNWCVHDFATHTAVEVFFVADTENRCVEAHFSFSALAVLNFENGKIRIEAEKSLAPSD